MMDGGIAHVEWIRRHVFNVGGSNTGAKGIGKHLKRQKGEGVETENVCDMRCNVKELNDSGAEETSKD